MIESRCKGVSWHCPKKYVNGFAKKLKGAQRYYGEKVGCRFAVCKRFLKGFFPLPASSMQIYLKENVEREKIERDLSDSLQLLQIEYADKFGAKAVDSRVW